MASLNEFIDPDLTTSDIVHSSGYARAAAGDAIGASGGGLSMEQRRQKMYGRRVVGSYAQSHLGRRFGAQKARTADQTRGRVYDASSDSFNDTARFSNRQPGGTGSSPDRGVQRRQHFIEPTPRRHDPYS